MFIAVIVLITVVITAAVSHLATANYYAPKLNSLRVETHLATHIAYKNGFNAGMAFERESEMSPYTRNLPIPS